jgi:hypothetical protein
MDWRDRFRAALVEVDLDKLSSLIHETQVAMASRSDSLPALTDEERLEMSDATCTMQILKTYIATGHV